MIDKDTSLNVYLMIIILICYFKQTKICKIQGYNAGNRAVLYTVQAG
jgi:hypothetical protein